MNPQIMQRISITVDESLAQLLMNSLLSEVTKIDRKLSETF